MYRIAICDDEEIVCSQFEQVLEPYIWEKKIDLDVFYSGEELIEVLAEGQHFDLIFLDIELCMMNGVEVGKYIRNKLGNENVQIVYISAKRQYAMELFETRPMNFLVSLKCLKKLCGWMESLEAALPLKGGVKLSESHTVLSSTLKAITEKLLFMRIMTVMSFMEN